MKCKILSIFISNYRNIRRSGSIYQGARHHHANSKEANAIFCLSPRPSKRLKFSSSTKIETGSFQIKPGPPGYAGPGNATL
jgi:hypothetical protein